MLDFLGSVAKSPLVKEMVVRVEELEPSKAIESKCVSMGEVPSPDNLSRQLANLSSFVGMLVAGFEKEISSLMWKMKARKGHGVKVSRGKKNPFSSSQFEIEIRKLECSVNYNSSPLTVTGRRSSGDSTLVL